MRQLPSDEGEVTLPEELCIKPGTLASLDQLRATSLGKAWPGSFYVDQTHGLRDFYLGYWNGKIAHVLWVAGAGDATTVSNWQPSRHEIEIRDVYTLPAYRARGIFPRVARHVLRELRMRGIEVAYAHVNVDNQTSLRGFRALGFVPVERLFIWRVLGFDWIRPQSLAPALFIE